MLKKIDFKKVKGNFSFRTISGVNHGSERAKLKIKIFELENFLDVFVIGSPNFQYDLLLGLDGIKMFRLNQNENLIISQKKPKDSNFKKEIKKKKKEIIDYATNFNEIIDIEKFESKIEHLDEKKRLVIENLINKYNSSFTKNKFDVGKVKEHEVHIKLIENRYIAKKPYRCSIPDQKEIEFQISNLLNAGLIEESSSPFAAPVTLAFKREEGKKSRLCIDFRELNKIIVPEPQPFPLIEEIMTKTRNCTWFSTLDINSAFWSIPIRIKDRYKTAFVTQEGHYHWKCLPFGLKTSPAIFQRILTNIIRKHNLQKLCCAYIDDIIIFSQTFEDHARHLEKLLIAINTEGFRLKFVKCNFAQHSVKYLGHIIEDNTIRPLKDNLIAIREFPTPKTKKNIRQFVGKINFYHKYIENATKMLKSFHDLLKKDADFKWTETCKKTFEKIKSYLCKAPILAIFDPEKEIIIRTDASQEGVGAVLKQKQKNNEIKPVAYFSKKLNPTQRKKKLFT